MPEGDTVHRAAARLGAALVGRPVVRFASSLPALAARGRSLRLAGATVAKVEAAGKHLLVSFSNGAVLHTHLGMTGSWQVYPAGAPWRRPAHLARAVLETREWIAVCFAAPTVEIVAAGRVASHPGLRGLGPDVVAPDADLEGAVRGLRARADREIGAALLDQSALAGIGNIYRAEVLFAHGVSPFRKVGGTDDETLRALVRTAHRMMRRSVTAGGRGGPGARSPFRPRVYGRARRPCPRCGTPIAARDMGTPRRTVYWCPACQAR